MAYLDDFLTQFSTTGATSYVLTLPDHVANDILVVAANADGGVTLSVGTSGWAQIGVTQISASASSSGIWWKRAAGSSETCTITMGTADAINVSMFVIKDVDTTTAIDVTNDLSTSSSAVFSTASTFTSTSVTTTTADCLVLYYLGIEPASTTPISALTVPGPTHFIDSSDAGGTTATTMTGSACAWYIQRAAGATPTPTWDLSASSITHRFVIAFRNVSGGVVPPYIDDVDTLGEKLSTCSWYLSATTLNNENYPTALTYANIGPNGAGQATTYDAPAAVVDSGFNPYSSAINSTPASTTTNAIGYQRNFPTTAINMTTGWIVGGFKASTSKMALYNQGNIKKGGTYLVIGQGSNYRSYRVMARDNQDGNGVGFSVISVQTNQTQTQYGYSSTSPTITAIDKMLILHKGQNATGAFYYTDWHFIKKVTIAGGTSALPVNAQGLFDVGRYCRIPLIAKSGASGLLAYVPIQIGGGDAVNFQIDAGALQFPRISSLADREINYHGANNAIGISYSGKSGDVIKHTNSVVTSPSPYYWEINSAATSAATWDFAGLLIVGANVTLRNVMTFDSMGFTSCPTLNFTGCTVTSGNIKNVPSGNDTLTTNSSTVISSSTINVTGVASGNRWCSVASPVIFISNIFTGSASTGHAIRITTPGTYSFIGNTFTSFGADGTNSAAIYNDSGGLVTFNISGGGNTPTIRNGAGASTTVNNNVTITITVKDELGANVENARVAIYKTSDMGELMNSLTNTSGIATTTVNYVSDIPVTIRVRKSSAAPKYVAVNTSGTIISTGLTATVTFVAEMIANNTTNATIAGDFTINTATKTIKHMADAVVYTAKDIYTWLMDYFDDSTLMDDSIPMTAQTPTEYTLTNGWFMDNASFKFLSGGAIQTSGQTSYNIHIITVTGGTYADPIAGDITKTVVAGATSIGPLLDYEIISAGVSSKWYVRDTRTTPAQIASTTAMTITSGIGSGNNSANSLTGENIWSNIFTLGSLVSGTTLDVYQNDIQIAPWWSSGQIDILVKVKEAGTEIDTGNLTVLARKYSTLYDHFLIDASTGRNPVPLAAFADSNNITIEGTVGAAPYTNITFDFGYYSGNLNNGNGAQPYDVVIDCATLTVAQVYEYLKYVTRTGSAVTFTGYGTIPGELYTAVGDIRLNYTGETSGPFVEGSAITSSAGGTGYIVSLIDNGATGTLVIRNVHGTFADTNTLTSGSTTAVISGTPETITQSKQAPFGTFAGGKFFGARGVWITNYAGSDSNNFTLIDSTGATQSPPSTISITVNSLVSGDQIGVYRTTGDNETVDKSVYVSHNTSNTSGLGSFTVTTTIAADTPSTGNLRVVNRNAAGNIIDEQSYVYTSWTGSVFTLSGTLSQTYNSDDTAYVPYIDVTASSTSTFVSIAYATNRYIVTRVRKKGIVPFAVKGQLTNANLTVTAIRTSDSIVT